MAWPTPLPEEAPEERLEENPLRPPRPPWPPGPPPLPEPPRRAYKPTVASSPASIITATRVQYFMIDIPRFLRGYSTSPGISTLRRAWYGIVRKAKQFFDRP